MSRLFASRFTSFGLTKINNSLLVNRLPASLSSSLFPSSSLSPSSLSSSSSSFAAFSTNPDHIQQQLKLSRKEIEERVLTVVKRFHKKIDESKITAAAHFGADLGLDSLDAVELVMDFEDEFSIEISDADADKIQTVPDAIDLIEKSDKAR